MGNVLKTLDDGSSWFTVVFAGVFISVVAGVLRDKGQRLLLSISSALSPQKTAHERERRRLIDALLTDPRYFELARFRATVACMVLGTSTVLYVSGPMLLAMQPASFVKASVVWSVIAPCLGVLSMIMAYFAARRVELINSATAELRVRRRLPKLP
jgi:hypothetical protein